MAGGRVPEEVPDLGTAASSAPGSTAQVAEPVKPKAVVGGGKRTITLTEQFYASPHDIYECFTEVKKMQAFTMSPATVEPVVGGRFSMFGGSIEGSFIALEADKRIEMAWRFSNWEDGASSKVAIELEEREKGDVVLHLTQTDIPYADKFGNHDIEPMTRAGWKEQVLLRIKKVFGY